MQVEVHVAERQDYTGEAEPVATILDSRSETIVVPGQDRSIYLDPRLSVRHGASPVGEVSI